MENQRLAAELEQRQQQPQELQRAVAAEEEMRLGLEEQYASLEAEVEGKTRKLKRLWTKYHAAQADILDVQKEFQREKEDLLDTIR